MPSLRAGTADKFRLGMTLSFSQPSFQSFAHATRQNRFFRRHPSCLCEETKVPCGKQLRREVRSRSPYSQRACHSQGKV